MTAYWIWHGSDRFPLRRGETVIGRSQYCTIVIPDPSVSREHAALRLSPDGLEVSDLGSRNGTMVNGVRVTDTRRLEAGDKLSVGTASMTIVMVKSKTAVRSPTMDTVRPSPALYGNDDTTVSLPTQPHRPPAVPKVN